MQPRERQVARDPQPPTLMALLLSRRVWSLEQLPDWRASQRRRTLRSVMRLSTDEASEPWRHCRSSVMSSLRYPASITTHRSRTDLVFVIVATRLDTETQGDTRDGGVRDRVERDGRDCPPFDTESCVRRSGDERAMRRTSRTTWLITELADRMNCRVRGCTYARTSRMI